LVDQKGIQPVKHCATYPQRFSVPEQVEESDGGKLANPDFLENGCKNGECVIIVVIFVLVVMVT